MIINQSVPSRWTLAESGDRTLRFDGVPALLLGGQVHNSSSSSSEAIARSFTHARAMNANAVLAPVGWALTEPTEGVFDFELVDCMLDEARRNGLLLVPLWFGAFKNALSTYAPRWVRADRERFPRTLVTAGAAAAAFSYEGAMPPTVLSVFSTELVEADARAFEALLRHLVEADTEDTVALVQVENESGVLRDSRDRSPIAEEARAGMVPTSLIELARTTGDASLVRQLWIENGRHESGTWSDVFGDDSRSDEIFMAWGFSTYVQHVAERGQAIKNIPMFANAWLGPQPGQDDPGQWPSGGPAERVLEVWRTVAPSLAFLGPDIYVDDAAAAMAVYSTGADPFFVPECRPRAGELVRALGTHRAIGWSAFGLDALNPDGQVASTLAYVTALEGRIASAQIADRVAAVVIEAHEDVVKIRLGDLEIHARGMLKLFRQMLLDVGVDAPTLDVPVPDETIPQEPVAQPGERRPFGLVVAADEDELIVIGQGLRLDFFVEGTLIEIDSVVELLIQDGEVTDGRVLNGDERLTVLPTHHVGAARIRLVRVE